MIVVVCGVVAACLANVAPIEIGAKFGYKNVRNSYENRLVVVSSLWSASYLGLWWPGARGSKLPGGGLASP